ncbi:mechanosensitive ion channel family protein [Parahaliea mediterranea]|uniref:Small-conductance mechanosensitive channel n=1 Tax=Parahaliea mediterranea TaxID=651086 RepID=A0A939DD77_9GAMM|nr:mechanosensitive ion channel family protein [Parahaliea mediterranea]MBN7795761.1 mechanosensitive ion channel [Parahaliea mediterranea]
MYKLLFLLLVVAGVTLSPVAAVASTPVAPDAVADLPLKHLTEVQRDDGVLSAPVRLDGVALFRVRGVSALPARQRAARIQQEIIALADNPAIDPAAGAVESLPDRVRLSIDGEHLTLLFPADAALEQVPLEVLAEVTLQRVAAAIVKYRKSRSTGSLLTSTGILVAITLVAGLLLYAVNALFAWLNRLIERLVKRRIERIERASHRLIDAAQLWSWVGGLLRGVRALALVAIVLTWLNSALGLYPWTRPFATSIFRLILNPLQKMGVGIVESLPDLVFLVVLAFVVRFLLKATKTFFVRIDRGWIRMENFDRDWAMPTYRIVRILIIAFALVVAYPYIPGSESEAFKGVSIFLGVVFSIGSSSFIANMIAGYSLTYRGAFREGDRVRIGEHVGDVVDVRALSTRLRSLKNEEINIPNSQVLSSAVVNYSTYQSDRGIILHTEVGIGYDVPWRQVEALLLMAAGRTEGLAQSPEPFVLQTAMGDFSVVYQLNAYCREAERMMPLYSALHANIQDVFNEHGVQIMSPHYEGDPAEPKLVPREHWYAAPANSEGG